MFNFCSIWVLANFYIDSVAEESGCLHLYKSWWFSWHMCLMNNFTDVNPKFFNSSDLNFFKLFKNNIIPFFFCWRTWRSPDFFVSFCDTLQDHKWKQGYQWGIKLVILILQAACLGYFKVPDLSLSFLS